MRRKPKGRRNPSNLRLFRIAIRQSAPKTGVERGIIQAHNWICGLNGTNNMAYSVCLHALPL
jgi:hypothetical protein